MSTIFNMSTIMICFIQSISVIHDPFKLQMNRSDIKICVVLLMRPNTTGIKADTRIWLSYNTEERCCLIVSTTLTQHKDHPKSVLLLSVHVIHNLSLHKSIKGCCQDKHQEIALLIDNSFLSLEPFTNNNHQQDFNMWQTTYSVSPVCVL